MKDIKVEIINQLSDNYSYLIFDISTSSSIIIDPAEDKKIIQVLKKNKLKLEYIFITHHHHDHTSGVLGLLKEYPHAQIYSPSELFSLAINRISDGDKIKTPLNEFQVFSSPGHTLDHVVLCDTKNNLQDSAPCQNCLATIISLSIKRIVFSSKDNTFISCSPDILEINHESAGNKFLKNQKKTEKNEKKAKNKNYDKENKISN